MIGNGWCRSICSYGGYNCYVNAYRKESSTYDECKIACNNHSDCIGFAISDGTFTYPNRCYVYGQLPGFVPYLTNPNVWQQHPISKITKIRSSSGGDSDVRCFKKLLENKENDGKFLNIGISNIRIKPTSWKVFTGI